MLFDVLIIGAGITGVAIARALAKRKPTWQIAVVEKEREVACHTSGRNSGVVHAGFNPKPGTLKARFCVEGNRRIREYCREGNVPLREVGTLVVARDRDEHAVLEELYRRGAANGVPDLELLDREELKRREPHARGSAALFAPTGSVVDNRRLVDALAHEARERGVEFFFRRHVQAVEKENGRYTVHTGAQKLQCRRVINAAGLYADKIAHRMGMGEEYTILPFRGEYYYLTERKSRLVKAMIYPVPNLDYPFLGIHLTPTCDGKLKVGPNAVLAFGRESYRPRQIHLGESLAMFSSASTWRLLRPDFLRMASHQLRTSFSKRAFLKEARTLVNGLEREDLTTGPPAGNRAQLVDRNGRLVEDMIIERDGGAIHILNVVSPGFTCALPFADYIIDLL